KWQMVCRRAVGAASTITGHYSFDRQAARPDHGRPTIDFLSNKGLEVGGRSQLRRNWRYASLLKAFDHGGRPQRVCRRVIEFLNDGVGRVLREEESCPEVGIHPWESQFLRCPQSWKEIGALARQ